MDTPQIKFLYDADLFPYGFECVNTMTREEAMARYPEMVAALIRLNRNESPQS